MAPELVACPGCHKLVHGEELRRLARDAETSLAAGDSAAALAGWRRALELLPPESRQYAAIEARLARTSAGATAPADRSWRKAGPLGLGGVAAFFLTKGKLLLLGLTKMGTLLSMLLSFGVYWSVWGWRYALGLVLSIYVHEMGHVAALRKLGIAANAPMFIPGLGALVRLKQYPATAREDAVVGLAGPVWGLGAAVVAFAAARVAGAGSLPAIAQSGAIINLFNLLPVWQLDGGRGIRPLSTLQRWILVVVVVATGWVMNELPLGLVSGLLFAVQALRGGAPKPDWHVLVRFVVLLVALSTLAAVPVSR
jgi:Zn-dependent protease